MKQKFRIQGLTHSTHSTDPFDATPSSYGAHVELTRIDNADGTSRTFGGAYTNRWVQDEIGRKTYTITTAKGVKLRRYMEHNSTEIWSEGWELNTNEFVTAFTNRLGNVTSFLRDTNNRVVQITYPDNSTIGYAYNSFGQKTHYTNQLGQVTEYQYGTNDLLEVVVNGYGFTNQFSYDSYDRVISHVDARGNSVTNSYNSQGLRSVESYSDGSAKRFAYNDYGQIMYVTNELGRIKRRQYDEYGQLVGLTDFDGRTTAYEYGNTAEGCCGEGNRMGQSLE